MRMSVTGRAFQMRCDEISGCVVEVESGRKGGADSRRVSLGRTSEFSCDFKLGSNLRRS